MASSKGVGHQRAFLELVTRVAKQRRRRPSQAALLNPGALLQTARPEHPSGSRPKQGVHDGASVAGFHEHSTRLREAESTETDHCQDRKSSASASPPDDGWGEAAQERCCIGRDLYAPAGRLSTQALLGRLRGARRSSKDVVRSHNYLVPLRLAKQLSTKESKVGEIALTSFIYADPKSQPRFRPI